MCGYMIFFMDKFDKILNQQCYYVHVFKTSGFALIEKTCIFGAHMDHHRDLVVSE